ncbi:MAG: DNA alkylation repair protein [Candidatus Nomurabacteria bacterium]|jgi:3-methyladenine DNA glycosylase AlkD|nr:DNA alkylation repair protein [Candidatus Nomurabacteria bacterium]
MNEIDLALQKLACGDAAYIEFHQRITNTQQKLLGVRLPDLRRLARDLLGDDDYKLIKNLVKFSEVKIYERVLLTGLMINYARLDEATKIHLTREYLRLVDSWGQIDSTIARQPSSEAWWDFALECLQSPRELTVRYGVVWLMKNVNDIEKLYKVFRALTEVKHTGYYVKMAIAWLYAEVAVKHYQPTLAALPNLDTWTRRKALTKMLESRRFTSQQKTEIRALRDVSFAPIVLQSII